MDDTVFNNEEVASLNAYQDYNYFHPFNCGNEHSNHIKLVAENSGWRCPDPDCDYTQSWAHTFMKDWSWTALKQPWNREVDKEKYRG